jgi:hypothetical protein
MPAISRPRQSAKARHLDKNCRKISIFTKQVCQRRIVKQAQILKQNNTDGHMQTFHFNLLVVSMTLFSPPL